MFGCIPKSERRELHREMATARFSEHLVNIYEIKRPTLVVLDGILAMEGVGPTQGIPKHAGIMLISNDGVLLDYYAAALMRYDPRQIEMIRIALERNLTSCPPDQVRFTGAAPAEFPPLSWNLLPVISGPRRKRTLLALCGPIRVRPDRCQHCGTCGASCPFQAIQNAGDPWYPVVDQERCQFCFCCLELCPHLAIMPLKFWSERNGNLDRKSDSNPG
jgi:ferredoxin